MNEAQQYVELSVDGQETITPSVAPGEGPAPRFFTPAVTVGTLRALLPGSGPFVDFPGNDAGELICARSTVRLHDEQVGLQVVLAFEDGDGSRPIILGLLQSLAAAPERSPETASFAAPLHQEEEPERVLISAAREITLRCGKASITLTDAGKLLLRGAYLLSRSSGVNRIKGGSVQIN